MPPSLPLRVLAGALCALPWPRPVSAAAVEYALGFASDPAELAVRVCLREPQSMLRFVLPEPIADSMPEAPARESAAALVREGDDLLARDWQPGECLRYRVDLQRVAAAASNATPPRGSPDLLLPTRAWLWRPLGVAGGDSTEIRVTLPAGWGLSVPWLSLDAAPHRHFRLDASDPRWPGMVAVGRFAERELRAGTGGLRLAITGAPAPTRQAILQRHVREVQGDVLASFPRLLDANPQLLLVPVPGAREPVPFGQSQRGGGIGIVLYVDPRSTSAQLRDSWTLTHELVHLAHPSLGDDGRWIAEGLATWYQNVLRARARRISADEAWRQIAAGFARGRADPADLSLRDTSRAGAGRHTMRLYWSGTALMMLGDVALRTRTEAPASLDLALSRYLACCRARELRLTPAQFLAALDRQVGGNVLEGLYRSHADGSEFPAVAPAWQRLGITPRADGSLRYDDAPSAVVLREAIMGSVHRSQQ